MPRADRQATFASRYLRGVRADGRAVGWPGLGPTAAEWTGKAVLTRDRGAGRQTYSLELAVCG